MYTHEQSSVNNRARLLGTIATFHLSPVGAHGTRLVIRVIGRGRPRRLGRLAEWVFWEPARWLMQNRQFAGLRRRAEASLVPCVGAALEIFRRRDLAGT
jgi:hypothetical protein